MKPSKVLAGPSSKLPNRATPASAVFTNRRAPIARQQMAARLAGDSALRAVLNQWVTRYSRAWHAFCLE